MPYLSMLYFNKIWYDLKQDYVVVKWRLIFRLQPDLVSSHRSFITRCEVTELSDGLSGRGNPLVLFLFTDQLEVCKKRSKAFNTLKSPNTMNGFHSKASSKPYKHICMLALNTIKRVIDIRETEDCQKVFALVTRDHQELKEKLFSFTMTEDDVDKSTFLKTLCRHIANTAYSADAVSIFVQFCSLN